MKTNKALCTHYELTLTMNNGLSYSYMHYSLDNALAQCKKEIELESSPPACWIDCLSDGTFLTNSEILQLL